MNVELRMREDWVECTLEDVKQDSLIGLVRSSAHQNNNAIGIPYLKMNNIDMIGNIQLSDLVYVEVSDAEIEKYSLELGDILINTRNSYELVGKTGIVRNISENIVFNNNIMRLRLKKDFNNLFINYQLISPFVRKQMNEFKKATTSVCALYQRNLFPLNLIIPSLLEQKAIVKKIEELFSSLDSGIADLKKAQDQLVIYRQAVLKKAFEGELTNIKQKNKDLPAGWKTKTVREVCKNIKVGIVIKPTNFYYNGKDGIKAFRSANVREFRVNDSNWVYFSKEGNDINKRTQVHTGDVLLVRSGYPGTSCVVPEKFNNSNAIDILIATPDQERILPNFLCTFNNSPLAKGLFNRASRGVAQKHLNVGVYSKLLISYPGIDEQRKILKEIESRLSVCDKIEESLVESLLKAQALRQSILKKAFDGKLLSAEEIAKCKADTDYEPASVLLERIKAEKK